MTRRFAMPIALCAALTAAQAMAQQSDGEVGAGLSNPNSDQPVEVTANQLDLRRDEGTALFTGDVVVVQGEMRLNAEWLQVEYSLNADGSLGDEVETITARDGVLLTTPDEAAEGDEAVYRPGPNDVVMTGDVLLTQGGSTVSGNRLVYDLATGVGRMESAGSSDGGRVRSVLQPAGEGDGQ